MCTFGGREEQAHAYYVDGLLQQQRGDYAVANASFRLAADRGHTDAALNLGVNAENGEGVEPNMSIANEWYHRVHVARREDEAAAVWESQLYATWYHPDLRDDDSAAIATLLSRYETGAFIVRPPQPPTASAADKPNDVVLSFKPLFDAAAVRHMTVSYDVDTGLWQLQLQSRTLAQLIEQMQLDGFLREPLVRTCGTDIEKRTRDEVSYAFAELRHYTQQVQQHRQTTVGIVEQLRVAERILNGDSGVDHALANDTMSNGAASHREHLEAVKASVEQSGLLDIKPTSPLILSVDDCVSQIALLRNETDKAVVTLKTAFLDLVDNNSGDNINNNNSDIGSLLDNVLVACRDEKQSDMLCELAHNIHGRIILALNDA
jgi:hypothetical protein